MHAVPDDADEFIQTGCPVRRGRRHQRSPLASRIPDQVEVVRLGVVVVEPPLAECGPRELQQRLGRTRRLDELVDVGRQLCRRAVVGELPRGEPWPRVPDPAGFRDEWAVRRELVGPVGPPRDRELAREWIRPDPLCPVLRDGLTQPLAPSGR